MSSTIKAFIFDLDGVITDTAEYHFQAWKALGEELGISFGRDFNEQLKGVSREESLERILALGDRDLGLSEEEKAALCAKKNDHYKQLIEGISPKDILPGIEDLLKDVKAAGIPMAIGSASRNAPAIIEKLELNGYFDYIVDAGKVTKGKPDPETFTVAADHFGADYGSCVGVEDAHAGIEALKAAGMFAVGVGSEESLGKADYRVDSTEQLKFDAIVQRFV
ncbi:MULTISPECIES: beta-phosphoglucomutase [Alteribacter]|uniref:Beta-phosphoglucomutase n=1 Tax=Alteribacter keqinensis TaxID=2483800 RepID=A0A3M7TQ88_9BACI|nr:MULTISPECIES: beta-phosphoglucomutase [Alteribacter]MBM7095784.1 beta-phosphoglucomutase [Alteribacter salitolerans]RNA67615.1 beta-phosphoglucomutase [Alteribacter keqinensis]